MNEKKTKLGEYDMIEHQEALKKVLEILEPLGIEEVKTSRATGRVLGEDVISQISSPPFDKAAMDGFAVRAEDTEELLVQLKVVGEISWSISFHNSTPTYSKELLPSLIQFLA